MAFRISNSPIFAIILSVSYVGLIVLSSEKLGLIYAMSTEKKSKDWNKLHRSCAITADIMAYQLNSFKHWNEGWAKGCRIPVSVGY